MVTPPFPPPDRRKPPWGATVPAAAESAKWSGVLPDKTTALLVELIEKGNLEQTVKALSGFHSRHSFSPGLGKVVDWIKGRMTDYGYTPTTHQFTAQGHTLVNVVAIRKSKSPAAATLVVGAHYDAIGTDASNPLAKAPGADDNATGVAVLLELARILRDVDLVHHVRFVAFAGEEQGLYGSTAYAKKLKADGVKLHRYLNLDMLGYPDAARHLKVERDDKNAVAANDAASLAWAQEMVGLLNDYTSLGAKIGPIYASDYMPFEKEGYVVAGLYEGGSNPHYHQATDTTDKVDFGYLTEVAQVALAAVVAQSAPFRGEGEVDLYIRDNTQDTGAQPSKTPHWTSPDIWVRNNPPGPSEDADTGHQRPIVGVPNYLYVNVHNRGTKPSASGGAVRAYRCKPGTAMTWPGHFTQIGQLPVPTIAPGKTARVGPFPWTPKVKDHECLVAIASAAKDHAVTDLYTGPAPHGLLVRYDNNVGQRNVSPKAAVPGGKVSASLHLFGADRPSINTVRFDASSLPAASRIAVRLPTRVMDSAASRHNLATTTRGDRWTVLELAGGRVGTIEGFRLRRGDSAAVRLDVDFSVGARHLKVYPLKVAHQQNGAAAGQVTIEITAVRERPGFVYGNRRTHELHTVDCPYWDLLSQQNKVPFLDVGDAIARGFDGCAYCLPAHHTG